jgi:tellurite resistance protein TerB
MPARADLAAAFAIQRKETLMETVVAACAAVAYADGWVTPEERRRLLAAIRASDVLAVFPPEDVVQHFDEVIARFEQDDAAAESLVMERIAGLKALRKEARHLVAACYAVAAADLQIDGEERALVMRVCELVGIDPAELDLVTEA